MIRWLCVAAFMAAGCARPAGSDEVGSADGAIKTEARGCRSEVVLFRQWGCDEHGNCGDRDQPFSIGTGCAGVMLSPTIALTARHCGLTTGDTWHWSGDLDIRPDADIDALIAAGLIRREVRAVYPAPDRDVAIIEFERDQPGAHALLADVAAAGSRTLSASGAAGLNACRTAPVGEFDGWEPDEERDGLPVTRLFKTSGGLDVEGGDSGGPVFWVDGGVMYVAGVIHGPGGLKYLPSLQYDVFSHVGDYDPACRALSADHCGGACGYYDCSGSCWLKGTPLEQACHACGGARDVASCDADPACRWYACSDACWPVGTAIAQACTDCRDMDGDEPACSAAAECGYYRCSGRCHRKGTPLDVGCAPPDEATCRAHDRDIAGCDATTGCGFYWCNGQCRPRGTPLETVCAEQVPPSLCAPYHGDVAGCDAEAGCSYYLCTGQCLPTGTPVDAVCGGTMGPIGLVDCRANDGDAGACAATAGCSYRSCNGTCWPTCVGDAEACTECSENQGPLFCALTVGCEWRSHLQRCVPRGVPDVCP
ncbi:trypsin-like serine peptidase [Sorangium sp. So ce1335]|uniref:trypsin-like serine peptidase n=1 Tax=Sorangium sp. So ce1335 TaxID=3133335 RepID=UPI003F5E9E52